MNKKNTLAISGRILWIYTKYQIITKLMTALILLPSFSYLSSTLIHMSGRTNLNSGNYQSFIFSIYGAPLIILSILFLIIILGVDINTFIITSALVKEGKLNIKMKEVFIEAIKSVRHFFSPVGVVMTLYVAFVLPLVGMNITLEPFSEFKIPNFITSVIFNNTLYTILYSIALTLLFILAVIYGLAIHFVLIGGQTVRQGLKSSRRFMKKYWKTFIKDYIIKIIKLTITCIIIAAILMSIVILANVGLAALNIGNQNTSLIMLLLSLLEIITFIGFIAVPYAISHLTELFYDYHEREGKKLSIELVPRGDFLSEKERSDKIRIKTKMEIALLLVLVFIFNFGVAIFSGAYFTEIFVINPNIEFVGHRAGGDLEAENTIEGVEAAIKAGASWTEIDVQRTEDGEYIINHDATFSRTAGVDKTPMEMSYDEIKELEVENAFDETKPNRKVASLEEILDTAKGRIGVFVELKEKSADHQMVDDVVKMIEEKGMLNECVILSLDYSMIEYTHDTYPEIKTGFLYFFTTGDLEDLKGDYLIMEEREATEGRINEVHEAGKKAVVWTVNTPESMGKFVRSNVDGIITDHLLLLNEAMEEMKNRSDFEIIIDAFIE